MFVLPGKRPLQLAALAVGLAAVACGTLSPLSPGEFSIEFGWQGRAPTLSASSPLYLFVKVTTATASPTAPPVAESGPFPFPGTSQIPALSVKNGKDYVIVVEMHQTQSSTSQVEYYGESQSVTLAAGERKTVQVLLELRPVPGAGATSGLGVVVQPTGGVTGYVNSATVDLLLTPGSGTAVKLANRPQDLDKAVATGLPAISADGTVLLTGKWNLNTGLTSADTAGCDYTMVQSGCPRQVYAQFVDAAGYTSTVVSSGNVVLDILAPHATFSVQPAPPSAAGVGDKVTISLTSDEALSGAPALTVQGAPALTFAPVAGAGQVLAAAYVYTPDSSSPNGTFMATASLADLAGNMTTNVPSPAIAFKIDTVPLVISNLPEPIDTGPDGLGPNEPRFSAVSGYNQVVVKFESTKALGGPGGTFSVLLSQTDITSTCAPLVPTGSGGGLYTCSYEVNGSEVMSGSTAAVPITVFAQDDTGAQESEQTTITLDFTPPSIAEMTVTPPVAGAGGVVTVQLTVDEPLARTAQLAAPLAPGMTFQPLTGTAYTFQGLVPASLPSGSYATAVTMTDVVGNPAVGLPGQSFTVDTVVPSLSAPTISGGYQGQRFSAKPRFNVVSLSFTANKTVDTGGSTLLVTIGSYKPQTPCTPSGTAPVITYTCSYQVQGTEESGSTLISTLAQATMPVSISATDEAGNVGAAPAAAVIFDFLPPSLASGTASVPLAGVGAVESLNLSVSEVLSANPTVAVSGPQSLNFRLVAGSAYSYQDTITSSVADGTYAATVAMTDLVGNSASVPGPSFMVDSTVPVISGAATSAPRYSAVASHNRIGVTFSVSKPVTLVATVGEYPLTCGPPQSGNPNFTCTYEVTGNEVAADGQTPIATLAEATLPVTITVTDAAANRVTQLLSVILDFTPPTLIAPAANPPVAKVGDTIAIVATASEELAADPVPHSWASVMVSSPIVYTLAPATEYTFEHAVTGADPSGTDFETFDLVDLAGNPATVGADGSIAYTIDSTIPTVTALTSNATRFSARAGFNQVILQFNTPEALDSQGASKSATIGQYPMTCGTFQATGPSYTCMYTVQGNELAADGVTPVSTLPEATLPVIVSTLSAAGNRGSGSTSFTFDFASPFLISSGATVATAGVGTTEELEVTASEALGGPPQLGISGPGALSFPFVPDTAFTWEQTIAAGTASGAYTSTVTMTDLVGNPASVAGPAFAVDTEVPVVSRVATNAARYSAVGGYNELIVTFDTPKAATVSVEMGAYAVPCGAWQSTGPSSYTCRYTITGREVGPDGVTLISTLAQAVLPVLVTAVDEAGNQSSGSTTVIVDFMPPSLIGTPSLAYLPAAQNVLSSVTAATLGTDIHASFSISEPLLNTPTVGSSPAGLRFTVTSSSGSYYVCDGSVPAAGDPVDGTYALSILATDLVGNMARITPTAPLAIIDTTPPAPPATQVSQSVVYTRVPWGSRSTDYNPAFSINGAAGAATGSVAVLAYDGSEPPALPLIGRGTVDGTGAFQFTLEAADRAAVDVAAVDEAGNISAAEPVLDVVWTATFDEKISGSTAVNPNVLTAARAFWPTTSATSIWLAPLTPDPVSSAEPASYLPVEKSDSETLSADVLSVAWTQRIGASASPTSLAGLAYDAIRGVTVLFGGAGSGGQPQSLTWEFDGDTWALIKPSGSPPARQGQAMTFDGARGRTVVFGGCTATTSPGSCPIGNLLSDTWEWDGATWTQRQPASVSPPARDLAALSWDEQRGVSVLFGGFNGTTDLNDTWQWDGNAWTQLLPAASPTARDSHAMSWDPVLAETLLFGGESGGVLGDTWGWNGVTWTPLSPTSQPPARSGHGLATDSGRGRVVLFGGENGSALADLWEWDGTTWHSLTPSGATPPAREQLGLVWDAWHTRTVLFGGAGSTLLGDTWSWDGTVWRNITADPVTPGPRWGQSMAYDAALSELMVFGGVNGSNYFNDTWIWGGGYWTQTSPASSPPARSLACSAYDPVRKRVVLFGGQYDIALSYSDVWEWDGTNWYDVTPGAGPPGRFGCGMAYDPDNGQTVMFGGEDSTSGAYNDTYGWNGSVWTNLTPTTSASPPARWGHAMAYDADTHQILVFSGDDYTFHPLNDVWDWNGTSWAQTNLGAVAPGVAYGFSDDYDPVRHRIVQFSGNNISVTWNWNGIGWENVTSGGLAPPGRFEFSAAYDADRSSTVIFGGTNDQGNFQDTWESPSAIGMRPAYLAQFSLAAIGESPLNIQSVAADVIAGGNGSAVATSGDGTSAPGFVLAGWDAWSGAWDQWGSASASMGSPGEVTATIPVGQASRYEVLRPQTLNLAVFPTKGMGNGAIPGAVMAVDYLEATVAYHRAPSDGVCAQTPCVCPAGTTDCNGVCVDLTSDAANCGTCGFGCPATSSCQAKSCVCPSGESICDGVCVDTRTDSSNCSVCGQSCATGGSCADSSCHCPGTESVCGGACVDVLSDADNCGTCGHQCQVIPTCTGGFCACPAGETACGSSCVNFLTDTENCGSCGHKCDTGQTCGSSGCVCPSGEQLCGTSCTNTSTDPKNCGGCGDSCGVGDICGVANGSGYCCPPAYPVFCASGAPSAVCWSEGTDCSTVTDCSGSWGACDSGSTYYCLVGGCVVNL